MPLHDLKSYHRPEDLGAAIALLEQYGDAALPVAGGTFIHGLAARGLLAGIEALVDIDCLGLDRIGGEARELRIGAGARFRTVLDHAASAGPGFGALRDALSCPPAQIVNAATVGGSVAAACPFFDLPVALLALNAAVAVHSHAGERVLPLAGFFTGLFRSALTRGELVTALRLPAPAPRTASAFLKLETNANDLALVNVAVCVTLDEAGSCTAARVFIGGGIGETPVQAAAAEAELTGRKPDVARCAAAGRAASAAVEPLSDHRASAAYRRAMAGVLAQRALAAALARLPGSGV